MAGDDPEFERKAAYINGLYLHPPQQAAVFCMYEKSAIQALDRLDPVFPMSPGRAERHRFEYYRHGTLSLYSALEVRSGKAHGKTAARQPATSSWIFGRRYWGCANPSRCEVIARGVFTSVRDLSRKLIRYVCAYSEIAKPFHWKYSDVRRRMTACYSFTATVRVVG